eukprot:g53491.t1
MSLEFTMCAHMYILRTNTKEYSKESKVSANCTTLASSERSSVCIFPSVSIFTVSGTEKTQKTDATENAIHGTLIGISLVFEQMKYRDQQKLITLVASVLGAVVLVFATLKFGCKTCDQAELRAPQPTADTAREQAIHIPNITQNEAPGGKHVHSWLLNQGYFASKGPASKILIVSAYDGDKYMVMGNLASDTKAKYAELWGYHYSIDNDILQRKANNFNAKSAGRIDVYRKHWNKGYEWIVWTDGDVLVTNPRFKLEDVIEKYAPEGSNMHVIMARDWGGGQAQTGVMFLKVSPEGERLLNEWEHQIELDKIHGDLLAQSIELDESHSAMQAVKSIAAVLHVIELDEIHDDLLAIQIELDQIHDDLLAIKAIEAQRIQPYYSWFAWTKEMWELQSYPHLELREHYNSKGPEHSHSHSLWMEGDYMVHVVNCLRQSYKIDVAACDGIAAWYWNVFFKEVRAVEMGDESWKERGSKHGPVDKVTIIKAEYGTKDKSKDVTALMQAAVDRHWANKGSSHRWGSRMKISQDFNEQFGDPVPGHAKRLELVYKVGASGREITVDCEEYGDPAYIDFSVEGVGK